MKKLIFILVLLVTIAPTIKAQQSPPATNDSIIFNKLVHEYGTIEKGSDGMAIFAFTNKGQKPLVLSNVRATCGCTVPEWTKQPVAPGETGEIKVKYNTNIVGNFNKTITVSSNAANAAVTLRIRGNVSQ